MNQLKNYKGKDVETAEALIRYRLRLAKEKEYLDMTDVSLLSGFSVSTIRRRIEQGVLKPTQNVPKGKLLFKRSNVERWLNDGLQK
tara:strand:- start:478 stop:735 length:258 start_codon:yes stop_codon:yes gene_type:complete